MVANGGIVMLRLGRLGDVFREGYDGLEEKRGELDWNGDVQCRGFRSEDFPRTSSYIRSTVNSPRHQPSVPIILPQCNA